jgi:hypothetical protein
MKILYTIAVFSFLALVWAAFAISRHIRKNSATPAREPVQDPDLTEAIDRRLAGLVKQTSPEENAGTAASQPSEMPELRDYSSLRPVDPETHRPMTHSDSSGPIHPATADRS